MREKNRRKACICNVPPSFEAITDSEEGFPPRLFFHKSGSPQMFVSFCLEDSLCHRVGLCGFKIPFCSLFITPLSFSFLLACSFFSLYLLLSFSLALENSDAKQEKGKSLGFSQIIYST
uniref:Transmembrane protein n=1 Tax=Opuntia streptacantha TaxID=393608 RepID=A0A7C8YF55_OPUST